MEVLFANYIRSNLVIFLSMKWFLIELTFYTRIARCQRFFMSAAVRLKFVGNKEKGWTSKRVSQENKGPNFPNLNTLIRLLACIRG